MTREELQALYDANPDCQICGIELATGLGQNGRCIDHDHETKRVRGILCRTCNVSLGVYEVNQKPRGLRIDVYEAYLAR